MSRTQEAIQLQFKRDTVSSGTIMKTSHGVRIRLFNKGTSLSQSNGILLLKLHHLLSCKDNISQRIIMKMQAVFENQPYVSDQEVRNERQQDNCLYLKMLNI
jgi:hypothetical protein